MFYAEQGEDASLSAGATFAWYAYWLGGFFVPLIVVGRAAQAGLAFNGRLSLMLVLLALFDGPLITAGVRGRGPAYIVQPWHWPRYLGWLAGRLFLFAMVVF